MNVRTTKCLTCGQSIAMAGICYGCGASVDPLEHPASEHAAQDMSVPRRVAVHDVMDGNHVRINSDDRVSMSPSLGFQSDAAALQREPERNIEPKRRNAEPASRTLLRIVLATTFTLFAMTAILRPIANDPRKTPPAASDFFPSVVQSQWESVARGFVEMGAAVRPYNPEQPNVMVVRLLSPTEVMPRNLARDIASSAQARLGHRSLVSVRDSSGKLLALASEYGIR